jgi:hypothetical protein
MGKGGKKCKEDGRRKEKGLMFYVKNKMASFKGVVLLEAPCG